jgi:SAM-dependent methyltransferase
MDIKDLPQPLGFFHVITDADALHYGYWPEDINCQQKLSLAEAQQAHSQLFLQRLPKAPAKILDVGCGLGLMANILYQLGYQVTAIAPSESLIAYATDKYLGPTFINCGFLDKHPDLKDQQFDVLLFQESLQYFPDLDAVFHCAINLLTDQGRLIFCDEVSYAKQTEECSAVHQVIQIEQAFSAQGFYVQYHRKMGAQVLPTCDAVLLGLDQKKQQMMTIFGDSVKPQIEQLIIEWQNLKDWYQHTIFGYELWDLRLSGYAVKIYEKGNENTIVSHFNQVFNQQRSVEHWYWKYQNNPQGGPCVSMAFANSSKELVSHYSAYPLAITKSGESTQTYHVGDTFTVESYRGVGRGKTNLLSRVVRLFHRYWCEGKVDFFYGFNTGRIQKLGKLFLNYQAISEVLEYSYQRNEQLEIEFNCSQKRQIRILKGFRIEIMEQCDNWADKFFSQVKNDYPLIITRDKAYLQWRYEQHPDFSYQYIVLKRWGKVIGWWVIRQEGHQLLLIDALILKQYQQQAVTCLLEVFIQRSDCLILLGWFSDAAKELTIQLQNQGFKQQRQFQNLDLCATLFNSKMTAKRLANDFYFTMGDSDLY